MAEINQAAFILRIASGGEDKVPEALKTEQIIIGWAKAEGLLDESLDWDRSAELLAVTYGGSSGQ